MDRYRPMRMDVSRPTRGRDAEKSIAGLGTGRNCDSMGSNDAVEYYFLAVSKYPFPRTVSWNLDANASAEG